MSLPITSNSTVHRTRTWIWLLTGSIAAVLVLRLLLGLAAASWPLAGPGGPASVDEILTGIIAWAGCFLAAWLCLGSLATVLAASPGAVGTMCGQVAEQITPTLVRKGISVLIGTSLGTVVLPTGSAGGRVLLRADTQVNQVAAPVTPGPGFTAAASSTSPTVPPDPGFAATTSSPGLDRDPNHHPDTQASHSARPAPAPDPRWRPAGPGASVDAESSRLLAPPPRVTSAGIEAMTVRRGDSLWSIAARNLGSDATDAEIARAWPQWYAVNRDVIGANPDLIIPGQQLRPPTEGPAR